MLIIFVILVMHHDHGLAIKKSTEFCYHMSVTSKTCLAMKGFCSLDLFDPPSPFWTILLYNGYRKGHLLGLKTISTTSRHFLGAIEISIYCLQVWRLMKLPIRLPDCTRIQDFETLRHYYSTFYLKRGLN